MAVSTTTTLNDLVAQVVTPQVQQAAYAVRVLRPLIRTHMVPPGAGSLVVPRFQSVSVASLSEGVAPASTTMSTDGVTLTPLERGVYVQISKHALHSDPFSDLSPYGDELGRALAQDEDARILAAMNFTTEVEATGAAGAVTLTDFRSAIATLEANNAIGPKYAIFHPNSWAKIRSEIDDWSVFANVGKQTVEGFGAGFTNSNGYVGSPYGVPCFISSQVGNDGGATPSERFNVMFTKEAVAAAYVTDIGVDVMDNVPARALDLMAWYTIDTKKLVDNYGVILEDNLL